MCRCETSPTEPVTLQTGARSGEDHAPLRPPTPPPTNRAMERPRRCSAKKRSVYDPDDAYDPGEYRARKGIFRTAIGLILKKSPVPLSLKAIHDAALADSKASSILALSNGKTHSNSLTSMCSKDVQKGTYVEVQGVPGVCKIGKHFIRLPGGEGDGHLFHLKSRYDDLISPAREGQSDNKSDSTATKRSSFSSDESTTPTSPRRVRARSCTSSRSSDSEVNTTNLNLLADTAMSHGANLDEGQQSAPADRLSEETAPSRKPCAWPTIVSKLSMDETMKRFSTCGLSKNCCRHTCCRSWAPRKQAAADIV